MTEKRGRHESLDGLDEHGRIILKPGDVLYTVRRWDELQRAQVRNQSQIDSVPNDVQGTRSLRIHPATYPSHRGWTLGQFGFGLIAVPVLLIVFSLSMFGLSVLAGIIGGLI